MVQLFLRTYLRVVCTVAGSNQSREHGSPFISWKVLGMSMSGPNAFKDDFILGLITSTARLHFLIEKQEQKVSKVKRLQN